MRRAVRMTRQAISPRLAIRILVNMILMTGFDGSHIRKTPNRVSGIGAFSAADRPERQARAVSRRVDDPVVPQARGGVVGMALALVLGADRRLERALRRRAPAAAAALDAVAPHGGEHVGGLLAAHDADARVRPHPQKARSEGAPAHAVVARAEAAADDDREFRHLRARDRGDHLRAVLGDAFVLVLAPDHEAGDVLQEHERDAALAAELDEVRAFERGLGEQDAVVGDDADRHAPDAREAGDERRAVARLELVEVAAVDDARDDLAHVERLARIGRDDAVQLLGGIAGLDGVDEVHVRPLDRVQLGDDAPRDAERVRVVVGEVIGDAREPRVHVAAAQLLGADHFAGRGFDQRRPAEENRALVAHDDRFVAHRRHVRAARRARAHHDRDLRRCRPPTASPGCRRCGRNARGRERPRPGSAGSRRPSRRDRCTAAGSRARSPARADASSP